MNGNIKASFNVDYINVSFLPVRQEVFDLYDYYVHGKIDRRGFMNRLSVYAVGGLTVSALMSNLMPNYAQAPQVKPDYNRIKTEYAEYGSPKGGG